MNERRKILELLENGKITAEQADLLLDALQKRTAPWEKDSLRKPLEQAGKRLRFHARRALEDLPEIQLPDLKDLGSQISNSVNQALKDAKKGLEKFSLNTPFSIMATKRVTLPREVQNASIETQNGGIHVFHTDDPFLTVHFRAQVKTRDLEEAQSVLNASVQLTQTEDSCQISILHEEERGVQSASVDIYLPREFQNLVLRTKNGGIQVDSVDLANLTADTHNGAVVVHRSTIRRIRLSSHNGGIDVRHSVHEDTESVSVVTHNGEIYMHEDAPRTHWVGQAKSSNGRIELGNSSFAVEYDGEDRPRLAHFRSAWPTQSSQETHLYLETHNGNVRVRLDRSDVSEPDEDEEVRADEAEIILEPGEDENKL